MDTLTQVQSSYQAQFEQALSRRKRNEPGWLSNIRSRAMDRFSDVGFPTTEDEDWRFTNVDRIGQTPFLASQKPLRIPSPQQCAELVCTENAAACIVFVDGYFSAELSDLKGLSDGVRVTDVAQALVKDGAFLQEHLCRYADTDRDAFVALNAALFGCGAVVHVSPGVIVEKPIHVVFISTASAEATACHPRNLIVAEANSQVAVVESYVAVADSVYFTNAVTEVVAGENAVVEHYMIERDAPSSYNVSTLRVEQHRNSNFASHSILLGGSLVRNNVHPVLNGEGAQSLLNGLYVLGGDQHADNHMRVEHAKPHCDSRQYYKGIMDDESHAVFAGRIIVHKDAQKTDAKQSNMNLLLTDRAQIDTKPQLEIYADDVKCTHGATIGQIDANAVFYLRSRGLSEQDARNLLIYAFVGESLSRMKQESLRLSVEALVLARLPRAGELRESRG
ncbi:MAG: Fe-S cluster assembly protein SufD [Planctomycetota bacterium]